MADSFSYTYGPVPSRRFGRSLGVSLIPPKTCSYSCVYCQLGRTDHLRTQRKAFFDREAVLAAIREHAAGDEFDYTTFVGDGEPTLSKNLGWLIQESKRATARPVAVITNGSLLYQDEVREELLEADVVVPSLDAGNATLFKAVNRPHGSLDFADMVHGLIEFRREYKHQIWVEVMLVRNLNDSDEALYEIADLLEEIAPDKIFIMTPIRPPAENWVRPPIPRQIIRAHEILEKSVAITENETGELGLSAFKEADEAILEIGSRHPLRLEQALQIEEYFNGRGLIDGMIRNKILVKVSYNSSVYLLPSRFIR